MIAIVQYKALY